MSVVSTLVKWVRGAGKRGYQTCECGCGQQFPRRQIIKRRTNNPDWPVEYLYKPHAREIYPDQYK